MAAAWESIAGEIEGFARASSTLSEAADKASRVLGRRVTGNALQKAVERLRAAGHPIPRLKDVLGVDLAVPVEELPDVDIDERIQENRAKRRARELERANKALHKRLEEAEERLEIALALGHDRRPRPIKPSHGKSKREAAVLALASDWHIGERIDPETVSGLNEYNPDIVRKRSDRFFRRLVSLSSLGRHTSEIDQMVIGCLGDMIHGYIHDEYKESNFLSPTEEIDFFVDLWVDGIGHLLDQGGFKRIDVVCKMGNHGRTTIKNRDSTEWKNSYEWLGYRFLERAFANEKRVNIIIGKGRHTYHDVMGWRVRFTHGHSIRGGNGVGGIAPPVLRAVYKWDQANRADLTVMGHFHQLRNFGHVIINGSLCGPNSWVESNGFELEEPRQAFCLIDRDRGLRMFEPIWVDDLPQLRQRSA